MLALCLLFRTFIFLFLIGYMFQFPFRDLFSRSSGSHFPDFQGGPSGLLFRSLRTSSLIPEQLAMPHVAIGPRSLLIRDFTMGPYRMPVAMARHDSQKLPWMRRLQGGLRGLGGGFWGRPGGLRGYLAGKGPIGVLAGLLGCR